MQKTFSSFLSILSIATLSCLISIDIKAQIVPDNSLGEESSLVIPFDEQGADVIDGGATRGTNLFHSFQEFNISPDRGAIFNNPDGINNIFSRVTGTNISNINGTLGVLGSANLFLINPNGIAFGENAALSIQGSFFASTADGLLFDNNFEFGASNLQAPPLLDISIPIGLNFRNEPGNISLNGTTSGLLNGGTFALVGGNLSLNDASVIVPGGRLELGGVSASGTVGFSEDGSLNFPDALQRGDVALNNTFVSVSAEGGGSVNVNARNFKLINGSNIFAGISPLSVSVDARGGDITIKATNNVLFDGMESIISTSIVNSNNGIGSLGNTEISARNISFLNGGNIASLNSSQGNAGKINLSATENITFDGITNNQRSGIQSSILPLGSGDSGNITITAQNLSVIDGATIFSGVAGMGNSGAIEINATDSISVTGLGDVELPDGTFTQFTSSIESPISVGGMGDSGGINLTTNNLALSDAGIINTAVVGRGTGGDILINTGEIVIDGQDTTGEFSSRVSSSFIGEGEGKGGNITIETDFISLVDGGEINSLTSANGNGGNINITATDLVFIDGENEAGSRSNINADVLSTGLGNAGNIDISTTQFSLTNEAALTNSSSGIGNAGNISISATDTFVADNSLILSNVGDPFDAIAEGKVGNIQISAREITLNNSAQIQAGLFSGATGEPGIISLIATDSIFFSGENTGTFSNNAVNTIGDASNAQLFAPTIILDDGAGITATNFGQGNGGIVTVTADNLTLNENNQITGATVSGTGGIVNLQITEDLILRSGNEISAQAVNDANGGNLTIDTELIIAFPNGNNDIIASASQGNGGNINITAESLFGIAERPLNPFTNDINASSEFGLQGNIAINTPEVDPTSGLINLPASVGDASDQISQNPCQQGVGSEFIVTGKGGLPPTVSESLNSESARVSLIEPVASERSGSEVTKRQGELTTTEAIPAQGWVFNDRGEVTLTAYSSSNSKSKRSEQKHFNSCVINSDR